MQFTTLVLAALASVASATSVTVVKVASVNNSLTYSPDNIKVEAGGMVQFQFLAGNHTVTQSTFDQPCQPISAFSNTTGFHSGFVPVAASAGMTPTYTIQINNTTPLWVYCAQGKHCEAGMVMVINENTSANSTRSLANFKAIAAKATTSLPGASTNTTTGSGSSSSSSTSTTSGTSTSTSAASTNTAVSEGSLRSVSNLAGALAVVAGSFFLL